MFCSKTQPSQLFCEQSVRGDVFSCFLLVAVCWFSVVVRTLSGVMVFGGHALFFDKRLFLLQTFPRATVEEEDFHSRASSTLRGGTRDKA